MKKQIPDPRRFSADGDSPLAQAAGEVARAPAASSQSLLADLAAQVSALLESGNEALVREVMRTPSSPQVCRALQAALDFALAPLRAGGEVGLQVFAIPVLFVTGATSARRIPGILSDSEAIRTLFEQSGVLGHCRNFGLSNALAAMDSVEAIPLRRLHTIARVQSWEGLNAIDLQPAEISVQPRQESVDLRFICGAALTAANAPAFVESAGDIGRWGMALTRELGRQLALPDVSVLAIPRPPMSLVRAVATGWFAARELGFQLFLSNALRQARTRIGEPDVTISAAPDNIVRIRLTSPFDEGLDQTYGWPLSPCDDLDAVGNSIFSLLDEARVERVAVMATVDHDRDIATPPH